MSGIKTILLHADGSAGFARRLAVARRLAEKLGASVTTVYCVTPALLRYPMASADVGYAQLAELDGIERKGALERYAAGTAGATNFRWEESDSPWDFHSLASGADLMVLGQPDPADPARDETPAQFIARALAGSGTPALLVPFTGEFPVIGSTVLIAWKNTAEATRAVTASLPWLQRANAVHAVCYSRDATVELDRLQSRLAAHGVKVHTHHGGPETADVGEQLLSLSADVGADLLVMGCYGHSRAREWLLGGASRSLLHSMTLPVLMVH